MIFGGIVWAGICYWIISSPLPGVRNSMKQTIVIIRLWERNAVNHYTFRQNCYIFHKKERQKLMYNFEFRLIEIQFISMKLLEN